MTSSGTTGYEEAAAQGIVAGVNAGLAARKMPPLVITRAQGLIGVLIDDLIVKGAEEPCEIYHPHQHICNVHCLQTECSLRAQSIA